MNHALACTKGFSCLYRNVAKSTKRNTLAVLDSDLSSELKLSGFRTTGDRTQKSHWEYLPFARNYRNFDWKSNGLQNIRKFPPEFSRYLERYSSFPVRNGAFGKFRIIGGLFLPFPDSYHRGNDVKVPNCQ